MIRHAKDGRTILSGTHYTEFRRTVWEAQSRLCNRCGRYVSFHPDFWHVHHIGGRGMGGAKRNDVLGKVEGLCNWCHIQEHGQ